MSIENKFKENVYLSEFTTFKIGGPARFFLEAKNKDDLKEAIIWSKENNIQFDILAGGSNVLISDEGVKGLVIKMSNNDISLKGERLECGAGATLLKAASMAKANDLSGLEWSAGIPRATIGGAVRGNAEAFDVSMGSLVETVHCFDVKNIEFDTLSNSMCHFGYRTSIFKEKKDYIIWSTVLKLSKSTAEQIEFLTEKSINFRSSKYPKLPSAGSIFKNINPEYAKESNKVLFERELHDKIGRQGKISAGLIIDMAGLKGKKIGGVKISLEHANHIVNTGGAKASDVIMLISYIKQQIRDKFGIQLREEIQYIGF